MSGAVAVDGPLIKNNDERLIVMRYARGAQLADIAREVGMTGDAVYTVVLRVTRLNRGAAQEAIRQYDASQRTPGSGRKPHLAQQRPQIVTHEPAREAKAQQDEAAETASDDEQEGEPVEAEQEQPADDVQPEPADTGVLEAFVAAVHAEDSGSAESGPPAAVGQAPEHVEPVDVEALLSEAETIGLTEHRRTAAGIRKLIAELAGAMTNVHAERALREQVAELSRQISDIQDRRNAVLDELKALTGRPTAQVTASDLLNKVERTACRTWAKANNMSAPESGRMPNATIEAWREAGSPSTLEKTK